MPAKCAYTMPAELEKRQKYELCRLANRNKILPAEFPNSASIVYGGQNGTFLCRFQILPSSCKRRPNGTFVCRFQILPASCKRRPNGTFVCRFQILPASCKRRPNGTFVCRFQILPASCKRRPKRHFFMPFSNSPVIV